MLQHYLELKPSGLLRHEVFHSGPDQLQCWTQHQRTGRRSFDPTMQPLLALFISKKQLAIAREFMKPWKSPKCNVRVYRWSLYLTEQTFLQALHSPDNSSVQTLLIPLQRRQNKKHFSLAKVEVVGSDTRVPLQLKSTHKGWVVKHHKEAVRLHSKTLHITCSWTTWESRYLKATSRISYQ